MSGGQDNKETLRFADGLEACVHPMWLCLSADCDLATPVPADSVHERLSRALPAVLARYTVFNLALDEPAPGCAPRWVHLPVPTDSVPVEQLPWPSTLPSTLEPLPRPPATTPRVPLFRVALAVAPPAADGLARTVRLRVSASHVLCDARTLCSMFAVVRSALPGAAVCDLPDAPLGQFGQADNFCLRRGVPAKLEPLEPATPGAPSVYAGAPSKLAAAMCTFVVCGSGAAALRQELRARGTSVQGVLMAAVARALRQTSGAPRNAVLYANVPADLRAHAPATPAFRERCFFCGSTSCFIDCRLPQKQPEAESKDEQLREQLAEDAALLTRRVRAAADDEACSAALVLSARAVDEKTGVMGVPAVAALFGGTAPMFTAAHVGVLRGCGRRPRFEVLTGVLAPASMAAYAYSSDEDDSLCVSLFHATTAPRALVDAVARSVASALSC